MLIHVLLGIISMKGLLCQDPCLLENNHPLEEPTRSVNYPLGPNDPDLCDRRLLDEGWYRVPENGNIATECPAILRCGSLYPVWLNGTLPVRGQRVTLNACQRGFLQCCENTFSVEVQNCNTFNVFYLTTIPACPGRYCTVGPPAPCSPGTSSETGFAPCQTLSITFSVTPQVLPFIPSFDPSSDERALAFRCQASMPAAYHRYVFDITWFINQNKIVDKNKIPYSKLRTDGVLHRKDWQSHLNGPKVLGFWVMCRMRARQSSVSVPTPYNSSKEFYAGAQIEKTSFTVKSGKEVTIRIKSTVPVACVEIPNHKTCGIEIELFSLKDQFQSRPANCNESLSDEEIKMSKSTCKLVFDGSKWTNYHDFKLQTLSDQAIRSSYKCSAKLIAKSSLDTLWQNYQLPEVYIHVFKEMRPNGYCGSYNDPHMYTFDGVSYTTHEKGEFVLFRHRTKPIEVHTVHRWEHAKGEKKPWASNCAIMFRAATDLFVIYGCNSPTRWITRRLNCEKGNHYLEVFERDKEYEVIMPTGTRFKVTVRPSWLNIDVRVSPSDWNQTEGICGTYNGNRNDDLTDRNGNIVGQTEFVSSWRVPGSQSLFIARSRTEKMTNEVLYCSCYNKSVTSDIQNEMQETADCTWKDSLPLCRPKNWKDNKCRNYGRTKREIADDFEFDVPLDIVKYEEGPKTFEWTNGWTEQKAINACESYFKKSKMFNLCSKITHASTVDSKTCVADIKMSGSTVFLSASLDSMKSSCINEIRLNTSFWKPKPKPKLQTTTERNVQYDINTKSSTVSTTSTTTSSLDIAESEDISFFDIAEIVFDNDCPNDCSESGICQDGICECNDGFEGEDCSVDKRKGPELFGLIEESFCDLSKRPCSIVSVFGNGFYASESVTCLIVEAKIEKNEVKPENLNMTTYGSLITFAEVKCPLELTNANKTQAFPVLDAYMISVSFDAIKYSKGSPIIVYDSTCMICRDVKGTVDCRMRDDVCVVERKCYEQEHYLCKPSTEVEPSRQTSSSEILYEPSKQTTSQEIQYEPSEQTTIPEIQYETSKQTTSPEIQYEPSKQTISPEIMYLGAALGGLGIIVVPTLLYIRRM